MKYWRALGWEPVLRWVLCWEPVLVLRWEPVLRWVLMMLRSKVALGWEPVLLLAVAR